MAFDVPCVLPSKIRQRIVSFDEQVIKVNPVIDALALIVGREVVFGRSARKALYPCTVVFFAVVGAGSDIQPVAVLLLEEAIVYVAFLMNTELPATIFLPACPGLSRQPPSINVAPVPAERPVERSTTIVVAFVTLTTS